MTVTLTTMRPCWHGLCIAGDCDGAHHVDATGVAWDETHGDQFHPETGQSVPTVPNAVTVTVTMIATVTVDAEAWAVTYGLTPEQVTDDIAQTVEYHAAEFSIGCVDSGEVGAHITRRTDVHQGACTHPRP